MFSACFIGYTANCFVFATSDKLIENWQLGAHILNLLIEKKITTHPDQGVIFISTADSVVYSACHIYNKTVCKTLDKDIINKLYTRCINQIHYDNPKLLFVIDVYYSKKGEIVVSQIKKINPKKILSGLPNNIEIKNIVSAVSVKPIL